jgi:hypothetical protein
LRPSIESQTLALMSFESELQNELNQIQQAALFRELRRIDSPQGSRMIMAGREMLALPITLPSKKPPSKRWKNLVPVRVHRA